MLKKFMFFPLLEKSLIKKEGGGGGTRPVVFNKQALNFYDEAVNTITSPCLQCGIVGG